MAKMTKKQALDKLETSAGKFTDEGLKRIAAGMPKLKASAKKLADKANESPELVDTLAKHLRLQMRAVVEGTTLLDEGLRRIKELENDEELFELLADDLAAGLDTITRPLENARKELAAAKKVLDQAAQAKAQHGSDPKQAREEWAEAVAEVDRLCSGAAKEIAAWEAWDKAATAAFEKRDAKELLRLQKAKPASASLDNVARQPAGLAYDAYFREFEMASLPEDLKKVIRVDRDATVTPWFKAQTAAKRKAAIATRVAALKVVPRDAAKALAVLKLPGTAKAKVQAALDGPAAALGKTLEAIAKVCKVPLTAADAVAKLKKEGVVD